MNRHTPLLALLVSLALAAGCGRDDDVAPQPDESIYPTDDSAATPDPTPPESEPDYDTQAENRELERGTPEVEVCTDQWFVWLNEKVMAMPGSKEKLEELYPGGLPEVGSEQWFLAMEQLTGMTGGQGADDGSEEWCKMMESRFDKMSDDY